MKIGIRIIVIIVILICTVNYYSKAQSALHKTSDRLRVEMETINSRIEKLYLTENVNSLISLYAKQLTFSPEYKPAILEIKKLTVFFKDWFKVGDIKTYKKKIYTVEVLADHILEIGTFNLNYSSTHNAQGEYKGKYMILWKRGNAGKLTIVSETFGADKYINPEVVPYADVQIEESSAVAKLNNISKELLIEIEESDALVMKAVADGDGDARAKGFTEDAILLANYDSIRVGMGAIRPKMLATYRPGSALFVKNSYNRIYDLGEFIFINAHYKGGWGDSTNGGRFEGNVANVLKRNEKGQLLMHRQISNNDRQSIVLKN